VSYNCSEYSYPEDKIDDLKGSIYEKLERVFDKFSKYHTQILLGDFNAKVRREDIFKSTIGNDSLHELSNNNGVRVYTLQHPRILLSEARCSHIVTFIKLLRHRLVGRRTTKLTIH
jgi:hypothetical protein